MRSAPWRGRKPVPFSWGWDAAGLVGGQDYFSWTDSRKGNYKNKNVKRLSSRPNYWTIHPVPTFRLYGQGSTKVSAPLQAAVDAAKSTWTGGCPDDDFSRTGAG
jgi:hypothetical protein